MKTPCPICGTPFHWCPSCGQATDQDEAARENGYCSAACEAKAADRSEREVVFPDEYE